MTKSKRDKFAKIILFKQNLDSKLVSLKKSINDKLSVVDKLNRRRIGIVNYQKQVENNTKKLPPKKVLLEYNNIFKESDFDYRMEKLFKFIEKYGIDHNSKIPMQEDEADPELTKYIYYDMQNVDIPICCKHYLMYKPILFSDNNTRNAQINLIKQKWGTVEGEYHICKNCGEPIEYIKYIVNLRDLEEIIKL